MIIQLTVKIVSKRRSSLERQNLVRFYLFCSVAVRHLSAAAFQFQLEMTTVTQQLSKAEHCTHRDRDSPAADCIVTPLSLWCSLLVSDMRPCLGEGGKSSEEFSFESEQPFSFLRRRKKLKMSLGTFNQSIKRSKRAALWCYNTSHKDYHLSLWIQ